MSLRNINPSPRFTKHLVASRAFERKPLLVADVGARGGFERHWSLYGDQVVLMGFEADPEECEQLNQQASGSRNRFFPIALHQNKGPKTFYVTAYPNSSGFYPPDIQHVLRFPDKVNLVVVKTLEINTVDFDSFVGENGIDYVDFIKLDTEGSELDILKGAIKSLRKSVIGLSIEVWFQQWHEKQPVFGDIDSFLTPLGFRLFDLSTYRISREALPVPTTSPIPGPTERGQVASGEVLYLRDGASEIERSSALDDGWNDVKVLKLASIMELFCLPDCAIELLQVANRKGLLQGRDVNHLIDMLVPSVRGEIVTHSEYLESIQNVKCKGYVSNIQRVGHLLKKFVPLPVRLKAGACLVKFRDLIDEILK